MTTFKALQSTLRGLFAVTSVLIVAASANGQAETPPPTERETWVNQEQRPVKKYELGRKDLAIEGYDPVAYFPEGGGKAKKGSKKITHTHRGVVYRFVNNANRTRFKDNPDMYEPAHGGWCSYAIAKDTYTEPNPKRFIIQNGRLFLFYDGLFGDTYKSWHKEGAEELEEKADQFWLNESGERARIPNEGEDDESDEDDGDD